MLEKPEKKVVAQSSGSHMRVLLRATLSLKNLVANTFLGEI